MKATSANTSALPFLQIIRTPQCSMASRKRMIPTLAVLFHPSRTYSTSTLSSSVTTNQPVTSHGLQPSGASAPETCSDGPLHSVYRIHPSSTKAVEPNVASVERCPFPFPFVEYRPTCQQVKRAGKRSRLVSYRATRPRRTALWAFRQLPSAALAISYVLPNRTASFSSDASHTRTRWRARPQGSRALASDASTKQEGHA